VAATETWDQQPLRVRDYCRRPSWEGGAV